MKYCGMDLHQGSTVICIIDDEGEVVERAEIRTKLETLEDFFSGREPMKVAMEAGSVSAWVSRFIETTAHQVMVFNPRNLPMIAKSAFKSDRVDAEIIARILRLDPDFVGSVYHRSAESQRLKARMDARRTLVEIRTRLVNSVRGTVKQFGYMLPKCSTKNFHIKIRTVEMSDEVFGVIKVLVEEIESLTKKIRMLDKELQELAKTHEDVKRLQSIPGVGPLTALYFVFSIENPGRFLSSRQVAPFLGLVPVMRSSGESAYYGRITKKGDSELRHLLIQAAHSLLNSKKRSALQDWGRKIENSRGTAKARVALARKLCCIMHHLWISGDSFIPFPDKKKKVA